MKVLWFTNTPCGATNKIGKGKTSGGWLSALEKEIAEHQEIQLFISFYADENVGEFRIENTHYLPIYRRNSNSKLKRLINRSRKATNNDDRYAKQLLAVVEKVQPDIIHVHGTEDNFGIIIEHLNVPVLVSLQGILGPISEKFHAGIPMNIATKYEGFKLKLLFNSYSALYRNMKMRVVREKAIMSKTQYIMGRTEWDRRVSEVLAPGCRYFVGNEILRSSFYEFTWQKKASRNKIRIVTVLSSALYKGLETVIKTASLLSTINDFAYEWLLIGLDSKDELSSLTNKWLKIHPEHINITFLGKKSEKELLEILMQADIFCQVSHIENSSNSLCEAMMIGMPIVATYAGGTPSLLDDKKEGMLVQEGEPYSLAGAIKELASDRSNAVSLGQNARKRALVRHNKKQIVNNLKSIYELLVEENYD